MNNPFIFESHVEGENFIGRERVILRLTEQLLSLKNVILLSPGGWGKTSLAREVSYRIWRYHASFRACFITILPGMTEKDIGQELLAQILMIPGIRTIVNQKYCFDDAEIFNLPEAFAALNYIKLIICFSGIHNILDMDQSSDLLKRLSKIWSLHRNCAYVLMGSVAIVDMKCRLRIAPKAQKIGMICYLGRFEHKNSIALIVDKFRQTGKHIPLSAAKLICQYTNQIPYFIQLLAWHSWMNTEIECSIDKVERAAGQISGHYRKHFQSVTENLTDMQLRYIKLLASGVYQPYSRKTIAANSLKSSGNVARLYKSMLSKEIIIDDHGELIFNNPFFKHWLNKCYSI